MATINCFQLHNIMEKINSCVIRKDKNIGLYLMIIFICCTRMISIFAIAPGNAPDEAGHIIIANSLSKLNILKLDECFEYSAYPYAIYNPSGYLPGSLLLMIASKIDPSLNKMDKPFRGYSHIATYIIRFGNLLWFALFLFFLIKTAILSLTGMPLYPILMVSLIPQITFVQTYVNTDSIGLFGFLYLIWALKNESDFNILMAIFIVMNSKLNYITVLPLPFIMLCFWNKNDKIMLIRKISICFILPILLGMVWNVWNYYVNGTFWGFTSLNDIYNMSSGSGLKIFNPHFIKITISSAFGAFGWLHKKLPLFFYLIWFLIFSIGSIYLFYKAISKKEAIEKRIWHIGYACVAVTNVSAHFWASYSGSYQPQGRYIFPCVIVSTLYFTILVIGMEKRKLKFARKIRLITTTFMLVSCISGLFYSSGDLNNYGYNIDRPGKKIPFINNKP